MLSISFFRLICCLAGTRWVAAQALTAWYTGVGAQVVYQNASTGTLMFTIDTGSDTGANGFTPWTKLAVAILPKDGTALAGTGYSDGRGNLYGQLFYLSRDNSIIEAPVTCTLPIGYCTLTGNNIISASVTSGVNNKTGLAALLRSANDGYQVFFQNTNGLRQLNYAGPLNITRGQDTAAANTAGKIPSGITVDVSGNLTVYGIDGEGNILTSEFSNGIWKQQSAISHINLLSWNPTATTIVSTSSATSTLKSLFYIGTDRSLHQLDSTNSWQSFSVATTQSHSSWPLADSPNAPVAIVSAGNFAQLFYLSGGNLMLASVGTNGVWNPAINIIANAMGKFEMDEKTVQYTYGLDSRSLIIVLLAVVMGVLALFALSALAYLLIRRRRNDKNGNREAAKGGK